MITVSDVNDYVDGSLIGATWDLFPKQDEAVNDANRIIDRLVFKSDEDKASDDVSEATILTALELANGVNPDEAYEDAKVKSTAFAGVRTTYKDNEIGANVRLGITSITAWRLLLPHLDYEFRLSLSRV